MIKLTAVEFNHRLIEDVKRLLEEGYVDLPKNYDKHPLKGQQSETILDVLQRDYKKYLVDEYTEAQEKAFNNLIERAISGRAKLNLLNEDGTPSEETPLRKLKTKNLSAGNKPDPNSIFLTDIFASPVTSLEETTIE